MDKELERWAASQGGAFTRAQALAAGYRPHQIRALLTAPAEWADPYRGVYVEQALLTGATPEQRHVVHAAARVLTTKLAAVVSHRSGALVHELFLLGHPPRVPQLTRGPQHPRDHSATTTLRVAPLPRPDRAVVKGVPVTSLARTACDVARTVPFRAGVVVADAALRRGADLLPVAGRCAAWPGGPQALRVVTFADGRADGPLESITRVAYAAEGLPAPETQVEVWSPGGMFLGLVDFLWRDQGVVGEADGLGKYDAPLALRKEKLREEGLRACGLEVVRNVWEDVWTAEAQAETAARVRRAFELAAQHGREPGVAFRVPTLAELLAPPWDRPY